MITNKAIQKKPEHKQVIELQSWYEPALRSLGRLLDVRKANLRKINRDEKNAAVLRDELIETLVNEHPISVYQAGEIVESLRRANKILMHGSFIYEMPEGDAQ